ncbi:MAG TPA: lectin [Xanthobacteraceae bacterium]|nr:lectin [Xanthobacteraceae bacterium]
MNRTLWIVAACSVVAVIGASPALAQAPGPQPFPMSFFVTSVGLGRGGDLGGLAGADAHCQRLAEAVGSTGKIWHAYLSTQARPGQAAINARDRIGNGPWHNSKHLPIAADLAELNGDTIELARLGSNLFKQSALNEKGEIINGVGDTPNMHDILTGSQTDGRAYTDAADHTCNNWTSSGPGSAQVGHSDRIGAGNTSWNSAHATRGCSQDDLKATGGAGLFYCFAIN